MSKKKILYYVLYFYECRSVSVNLIFHAISMAPVGSPIMNNYVSNYLVGHVIVVCGKPVDIFVIILS